MCYRIMKSVDTRNSGRDMDGFWLPLHGFVASGILVR